MSRLVVSVLAIVLGVSVAQGIRADDPSGPQLRLLAGWNLVQYPGPELSVEEALTNALSRTRSVWAWQDSTQTWEFWSRQSPAFLNTLRTLEPLGLYWIRVSIPTVWTLAAGGVQPAIATLLTTCPTPQEIALFERDLELDFTRTTVPSYACSDGIDPNGANPRLATFQIFRVMRALTFDEPLPWTSLPLYDWLREAVPGIVFFEGESFQFCCDEGGRMWIKVGGNSIISNTAARYLIEPGGQVGLMHTMVQAFVHEARHGDGLSHTCGSDDQTLEELGSWGVVYHLFVWLAVHADAGLLSDFEREAATLGAVSALGRICEPPPE